MTFISIFQEVYDKRFIRVTLYQPEVLTNIKVKLYRKKQFKKQLQLKNSCAAFASNFNLITSNNYFPAVLLQHVFSFFYFNVCCIFNLSKHVGNVRDMHFIPIRNTKGMSSGCVCVCVCVCVQGGCSKPPPLPFFFEICRYFDKMCR